MCDAHSLPHHLEVPKWNIKIEVEGLKWNKVELECQNEI